VPQTTKNSDNGEIIRCFYCINKNNFISLRIQIFAAVTIKKFSMLNSTIESPQNPKIKQLMRLTGKNSERKTSGLFVVEGVPENERALHFGYKSEEFFICEKIYRGKLPKGLINLRMQI
jgi:hypothetical protein